MLALQKGDDWLLSSPFASGCSSLAGSASRSRRHIHCAIGLPSHFEGIALENLICDCWAKVEWGYGRILVRDGANAGWINYMLKDRQKSEFDGFVDCIVIESLHNRVLQRQQERRKDTSRKAT